MEQLNKFISLLTGRFHNSEQYETMKKNGIEFPFAEHVNTVCNDKSGICLQLSKESSCLKKLIYTSDGKTHASPHLFLFTERADGVKLTSYETPDGYKKDTFTYEI